MTKRAQNAGSADDLTLTVSTASRSLQSTSTLAAYKVGALKHQRRKDKTMVHILETLQRLEFKFDHLSASTGSSVFTPTSGSIPENDVQPPEPQSMPDSARPSVSHNRDHLINAQVAIEAFPGELQRSYQHLTIAHKIILWPSVYFHILNSGVTAGDDLQFVLQEGTPWLIHLEMSKHAETLPCDTELRSFQIPSSRPGEVRKGFPSLSLDNVQRLTDAYFSTFNIHLPILHRDTFMTSVVAPVMKNGYADGDPAACLALLVFALGQVAIDGIYGAPIATLNNTPSGLRGGTAERPPGLDIFNEARRRIGFIQSQCSLESVQIHLLLA